MKIFAIGRNYSDHAKELNSEVPKEPIFFMKPETAVIKNNKPFYIPDFSNEIHYETEIIVKICRNGKSIPEEFAGRYYDEIGIGIDFTARDIQRECIKKGLPWEIAKGFDGSAVLGKLVDKNKYADVQNIGFSLDINGTTVQKGNTCDMIFKIDRLISHISRFISLKMGDILFTGTPVGVGPVKIGDHLQAKIEDELLLDFDVK